MAVMGSSHLERGRKFNFRRRPIDVTVAYCTWSAWVQCARLCVQTAPKITVYFKALACLEISEVSNQVISEVSKCFSTAPHIRSHRAPCSCFPKQASLQLSSEQSVGDVGITQLDWKRVPEARSGGCKSSVAITAECWRHHASGNVS